VKSDSKIASPLFLIRNNKGDVSSDYLGKGEEITIPLPIRNEKVILLHKLLNVIGDLKEEKLDKIEDDLLLKLKDISKLNLINVEENEIIPTIDDSCPTMKNDFNCLLLLLIFLSWMILAPFYILFDIISDIINCICLAQAQLLPE